MNNKIANCLSNVLSSMYFFWFCFALIIAAFINPKVAQVSTFVSGTIIQLLALPVLAFVSNQSGQVELNIIKQALKELKNMHSELHNKIGELK